MFKKIKEFIKAFKDAHNAINVNKINAKNAIDNFKIKVDSIVYTADSLKNIFELLEANYICFPIKERQDFIQKTLDLLMYGRYDDNGGLKDTCGWSALYILESVGAKNNLAHLNELYKGGKYDEVMKVVKEYSERLEEFYVLYNIIDKPNNDIPND